MQTLDGAHEVHVSLQDEAASVTVDRPERSEAIIQAIDSLGYKATVAGKPPPTISTTAD